MKPPSAAENARHEAAHAVVGVRLGLPVKFATIRRAPMDAAMNSRMGREGNSEGRVEIDSTVFPSAKAGGPLTVAAREAHERLAVQTAAGILVEYRRGGVGAMVGAGSADIAAMLETANILGIVSVPIGATVDPATLPDFQPWMNDCVNRAAAILESDDGAAWDRVRMALERKRFLSGTELRTLIGD
jgi:hypothetical protein